MNCPVNVEADMDFRDQRWLLGLGGLVAILLLSCGRSMPAGTSASTRDDATVLAVAANAAMLWPKGLRVLGDGYPRPGDPCRRLGETELTVNYLDDSAQLVGCPGAATAAPTLAITASLHGRVVGAVEGVTLVSVPQGDANAGMAAPVSNSTQKDN
jgi:hypothetical protein